jgi:hypothetical protein
MAYALVVTPAAEAQLSALPIPLAQFVRQQLQLLIQATSALSKPAPILHPRGKLFEIHYDHAGASAWVSIIFRYGQDEQTLHVEHIVAEFG